MGQDQAAGDTKHIGEGLETPVRTGPEEQEGGKVALLAGQVLDKVEAQFADRVQAGFEQLGGEVDVAGLEAESIFDLLEGDAGYRSLLQMLTIAIMQAYYQDPRVLALHGLATRPPFPDGHVVEAGDWTLLDPVVERGVVYRPAD